MRTTQSFLTIVLLGCGLQGPVEAYVFPQLGGGNVPQASAPMKHISVSQNGTSLSISVDDTVDTPLLRALEEPDQFDPAADWAVLQDKAHNFQYGWLPSGVWNIPSGSGVFVEHLDSTPGLESYYVDGLLISNTYNPILGTEASSAIWQWDGAMTHNAYAVLNPILSSYEATYRVYIGDEVTAVPLSGYQSAEVTISFDATPVLTADFNDDTFVDEIDLATWQQNYGETSQVTRDLGDANADGAVDGLDFLDWQRQFSGSVSNMISVVPEPTTVVVALIAVAFSSCCRSCGRGSSVRLRS